MSADPSLPADASPHPAAWAEEVLRRQVMLLEALSQSGLRLAQAVERGVTEAAQGAEPAAGEAAMAFSRAARAVRMTALLQARLIQDIGRLRASADAAAEQAREQALAEAEQTRARLDPAYGHKARVEAVVARVARSATDDPDEVDRLVIEAGERLDDDDIYGDLCRRPVGELVSLICRDLGLDPDWTRLAEEAWAQAEAGHPRSPFPARAAPEPAAPPPGAALLGDSS